MTSTRLTFNDASTDHYELDRIIAAMNEAGFLISRPDAYRAWCAHSAGSAAGWLHVPEDDNVHIVHAVCAQCYEEPGA